MGSRKLKAEKQHRELLGRVFQTLYYGQLRIIECYNTSMVLVEFITTGYVCYTKMNAIKKGLVRDHTATKQNGQFIYGQGVIGNGKYLPKTHNDAYQCWLRVLERCFCPKQTIRYPTYVDCTLDDNWYNFQHFALWYEQQIKQEGWHLDKDIIKKGNKIYGPQYCAFVPPRINTFYVNASTKRGNDPIGVYFRKDGSKRKPYAASCGIDGKTIHLGHYLTSEDAFMAYKKCREGYIKQVAEEYKHQIDIRVYEAMMKYQVEITD